MSSHICIEESTTCWPISQLIAFTTIHLTSKPEVLPTHNSIPFSLLAAKQYLQHWYRPTHYSFLCSNGTSYKVSSHLNFLGLLFTSEQFLYHEQSPDRFSFHCMYDDTKWCSNSAIQFYYELHDSFSSLKLKYKLVGSSNPMNTVF